jgi:rRNA maturation endonuclease Nob1
MPKLEIIKKVLKYSCYCCSKVGGKPVPQNECKICGGTGIYKETFYFHIYTDKKGNKICFSGDSIK